MSDVPESHPRYGSLRRREALAEGLDDGLVAREGLVAHGRGEAFDYLLGEETIPPAREAARAGAAHLLAAERPVISVNGNTAVLAADGVAELAEAVGARVEVNLFHRTLERVRGLSRRLEQAGVEDVLGADPDDRIPGLEHDRGLVASQGIGGADVVVVPLEDGDRTRALREAGKAVVAVDLNPLSRTARDASVTVVDEVTRALPAVAEAAQELRGEEPGALQEVREGYDHRANLEAVLDHIRERLATLEPGHEPQV
jgi:4-phosphopantoate--beta-alanine ligase